MKDFIARQGDVLLVRVASLPKGVVAILQDQSHVTLMHGEATGHQHRIIEKEKVSYFDAQAERFLRVLEKTALTHEEHSAVILDKGIYRQAFQVEEKREEIRRVAD